MDDLALALALALVALSRLESHAPELAHPNPSQDFRDADGAIPSTAAPRTAIS
jgi:hypothetical protein